MTTTIQATIVPGFGYWCRTKNGREYGYRMSFGRTLHEDCDGYAGPVPITVDLDPKRAVEGDHPFIGPDGLSGWIRGDGFVPVAD